MKNTTDYSDELADLKQLHEENIGRKFSDEEFNEIFNEAIKRETGLFKRGQRFVDEMMGMLMLLDDATNEWEKERLVKDVKGNPKEDIKKMMADLKKVIEFFVSNKNPNWGDVGTLANIHEQLGEQLFEKYDKHTGYSKSIEEGMKRHTEASQNLWLQAESEVDKLDPKKHLPDLVRWKNFFSDLLEGFQGILIKTDSEETSEEEKSLPKLSIRTQAIELAKKLEDEVLMKYLETAPIKTIKRRMKALYEEVEKLSKRPAKPANAKAKKKGR